MSHPAGVRGLKHIIIEEAGEYHIESHPAGVRGLKRLGRPAANIDSLSHPAGVRGLKPLIYEIDEEEERVAPRRGAWIETSQSACLCRPVEVAPRRGAWIETGLMGLLDAQPIGSHPAGVRGLKLTAVPNGSRPLCSRTPQGCVD